MPKHGPEFYDQSGVFSWYLAKRSRVDNPNDTLEKPVFDELAGDLRGLRILDLGCGDAYYGVEALKQGARSYLGLEGSVNMFGLARENLKDSGATVIHARLESWDYPEQQFDLVTSRLALHYLEELAIVFANVQKSLVPGGRLVFSVEHPVITSCERARPPGGLRLDWIVDDYFVTGRRVLPWMGDEVVKYHRTLEVYFALLVSAGLAVEGLRESRPRRQHFADEETYRRRLRIPLMLFFAARRNR